MSGESVYIHCLDGHDRTALISILLMILLYGIGGREAFTKVNDYHTVRFMYDNGCEMLECDEQLQQIYDTEELYLETY